MFKTLASVAYEGVRAPPPERLQWGAPMGGLFNVTSACISLLRLGNIHSTFHCIVLTQSQTKRLRNEINYLTFSL